MSSPHTDIEREKFVIGEGLYTNYRTAMPCDSPEEFRIDPAPIPIFSIVIHNILFMTFSAGLYYFSLWIVDPKDVWFPIAMLGIGIMTCILFSTVTYCSFSKANQLGPWLVYDKSSGSLSLPRQKMIVSADEIVHLQYVTTGRVKSNGKSDRQAVSELNLIVAVDGARQRIPLLRSIFAVNAFEYITQPITDATQIEVVRIKE